MSEYTAELSEALFLPDATEPHIVIAADRSVIVPDELKNIAVQFDHNVETVTFDCPRYWDEHDLSTMHIYVNYRCADGKCESYVCNNPVVDENDETIIHFDWTVSRGVTCAVGTISFLVCAKTVGSDGNLQLQWSSSMNQEMVVSEGLDPDPVDIDEETSDLIEYLLTQMTTAVNTAGVHAAAAQSAASVAINAAINATEDAEKSIDAVRDEKINDIKMAGTHEVDKIHEAANERLGDFDAVGAVRFDRQELSQTQKEQVKANVDAGGAIVCEASGETVTIADASDQPLRGLKLYGKSVQNGTPTPENPAEIENAVVNRISSVGANLIPFPYRETNKTTNGITFTTNSDRSITISGTASGAAYMYLGSLSANQNVISVVGECTISGGVNNDNIYWAVLDGTENPNLQLNSTHDFTGKTFALAVLIKSGVTINNVTIYPMMNYGTTALPYEPYKGGSATLTQPVTLSGLPVSSGGNYTDANGQQWICDEMDFARGVKIQRFGSLDMGSLNWEYRGSSFRVVLPQDFKFTYGIPNLLCAKYETVFTGYAAVWAEYPDKVVGYRSDGWLMVKDSTYTDAATFKAAMSGVMLYYELATPVETPIFETDLTAYRTLHTNKPNTTVYTDSNAGLTVAYAADTKTYIDNKFAELAAAVLQNA